MKDQKRSKKAFGVNEYGFVNYPPKVSNVKVARVLYGIERGCEYCFPHGFETTNATVAKNRRSWKFYRKYQWRK